MDSRTKIGIKYFILCSGCFLLGLLFVSKCHNSEINVAKKRNYDSLFNKIKNDSIAIVALANELIVYKAKTDSLTEAKQKIKTVYVKSSGDVRNEIKQGICDTNSVKVALNDCDSLNVMNERIIVSQDASIKLLNETVSVQKDMIEASRAIISGKDKDYQELEESSKKAIKKQKRLNILSVVGHAIKDVLGGVFLLKQ